jgi:RimJ/RimL family protein N-acetyltransferase
MVAGWVREAEASSNGARLEVHPYRLPDDLLDEFCPAATELFNTMPQEGMEHGDIVLEPEDQREWYERLDTAGAAHIVCFVRDSDGTIVGTTDVVKYPHEEGWARQQFTGVHARARGRGFGKWLKAAMLEHVRRAHPDTVFVTTENAGSNEPMLAINRRLGFQRFRTTTWYQVGRDELATPSGAAPRGRSGRRP